MKRQFLFCFRYFCNKKSVSSFFFPFWQRREREGGGRGREGKRDPRPQREVWVFFFWLVFFSLLFSSLSLELEVSFCSQNFLSFFFFLQSLHPLRLSVFRLVKHGLRSPAQVRDRSRPSRGGKGGRALT